MINHLIDEEAEDFRLRLDMTLNSPGEQWPGIDPEAWVVERRYNDRNLAESIKRFQVERQKSLNWLASLKSPDLNTRYNHPVVGIIRAGDLLTSWIAHDLLHIRQIARLKALYLDVEMQPYSIKYASP